MDWITAVERTYDLEPDLDGWLRGVLGTLAEELDRGFGIAAQVFRGAASGTSLEHVTTVGGPADLEGQVRAMTTLMPAEVAGILARPGWAVSVIESVEPLGLAPSFQEALFQLGGARDVVGFAAHDAEERVIWICSGRPEPERIQHPARLRMLGAHIGSGARLRRRLAEAAGSIGEGVLSPSGGMEHATGDAVGAREALAHAVRERERARGPLRRTDADAALRLWRGLVLGRWSLVDRIESDGRRYVVAHRNDPRVRDPRGLTRRELMVAEALGRGQTLKEIAYDHGVSASAVTKAAARARRKLRSGSLAELAAFFAPGGPRARMEPLELSGETVAIASLDPAHGALDALSPAEREIALSVLRGATNEQIASARGTSPRTTANQVQCIFAKMGVGSRAELAHRLMGARSGTEAPPRG